MLSISPLKESLAALSRAGLRHDIAEHVAQNLEHTVETLHASIVEEISAFTESGNPDVLPQLESHIRELLSDIQRLLGGAQVGNLAFVRQHASRLADQRFPLEAMLHAYRVSLRTIRRWLQSAALETSEPSSEGTAAITEFAIDYVDGVSTISASEYVRRTREQTEREADRRSQLLSLLLEGYDESDGRVTKLLRSAGYLDQRQSYCVVLASSVDAREMFNPARANRLLVASREALGNIGVRVLLGFHEHRVVAVVSATRRTSGWTAPHGSLSDRLIEPMLSLGNAILSGISSDFLSTSAIPSALREAEMALEIADPRRRVVNYSEIALRTLLLHTAGGRPHSTMPKWAVALKNFDSQSGGKLLATLRAYADSDMNVLKTSKLLSIHANTIYARMQKIRDVTNKDPLVFHDLDELLLAADWMSAES